MYETSDCNKYFSKFAVIKKKKDQDLASDFINLFTEDSNLIVDEDDYEKLNIVLIDNKVLQDKEDSEQHSTIKLIKYSNELELEKDKKNYYAVLFGKSKYSKFIKNMDELSAKADPKEMTALCISSNVFEVKKNKKTK